MSRGGGWTIKYRLSAEQAHDLLNRAAVSGANKSSLHGVIDCAARSGHTISNRGTDQVSELKYSYEFKGLPITITICSLIPHTARVWMEGKELEALS